MAETSDNNRRAAKNALALAFRMVIVTLVGLYTSRVVLEALGVSDYGIYGVVGGIIVLASFVNKAMASATSRFITIEIGKGNEKNIQKVFSTSFQIHLFICLLVILFGETIGLWLINYKMNFPHASMHAVNVLYQLTILSTVFNFTQIPYNAEIIAHEKMGIFAGIELLNSGLKLGIVFILFVFDSNRLIIYGVLTFLCSVCITLIYRLYCIKKFKEAKLSICFHKDIAKALFAFSSFSLYSSFGTLANSQGKPIVLNLYFGVIANAASSIALTVVGAIEGLSTSVAQAFYPQIIKQFSQEKIESMEITMRRAVQFSLLIFGAITIPVIIETPSLLQLWLGQIPEYTVDFIRIILIIGLLKVFTNTSYTSIVATGRIRSYSLIVGTLYVLCPICAYILLKYIKIPEVVYVTEIAITILIAVIDIVIIRNSIRTLNISDYVWSSFRSYLCIISCFIITWEIKNRVSHCKYTDIEWLNLVSALIFTTVVSCLSICTLYPIIVLKKEERRYIFLKIKGTYNKINNLIFSRNS